MHEVPKIKIYFLFFREMICCTKAIFIYCFLCAQESAEKMLVYIYKL